MRKSFVEFRHVGKSDTGKTEIWKVWSTSGSYLGEVKWFGRWRAYCFWPQTTNETIFNSGCLIDIAGFCMARAKEHRGDTE